MNFKTQAAINTSGNFIYFVAVWSLTVITTNALGYEDAGILTLAMTVGNVIAMIQMYGVRSYQASDMSFRYSPGDYLKARALTVVISWIIGIIICITLGYSGKIMAAVMGFGLVKTSESFSDVLFGNDQRMGHLEYAGYSMIARGFFLAILFCLGVSFLNDLNAGLFIAGVGLFILSIAVDLPLHQKMVNSHHTFSNKGVRGILKDCFPLLLAVLIPVCINLIPRVALEWYYGVETLGYYGNVSTPGLLLTTVVPTVLTAIMPLYGEAVLKHDYRRIQKIWIESVVGVVGLTGICGIGTLLIGRSLLAFVYTDAILPYVDYLYFILISMMFYAITMCNNCVLTAVRKNLELSAFSGIALAVCISSSVFLVKNWSINGAIASLAIPFFVQIIIQGAYIIGLLRKRESCV